MFPRRRTRRGTRTRWGIGNRLAGLRTSIASRRGTSDAWLHPCVRFLASEDAKWQCAQWTDMLLRLNERVLSPQELYDDMVADVVLETEHQGGWMPLFLQWSYLTAHYSVKWHWVQQSGVSWELLRVANLVALTRGAGFEEVEER